ncbi:MAG: hypothetical protein DSY42_07195 [Aquifex sp.]|nr:MAG: hypothetical protein DSY42_07195 [Aquifex sp.]
MAVLTDDIKKDIALIYVGVFGRAPEGEGLKYWEMKQQIYGWDLRTLAENMYQAAFTYSGYERLSDSLILVTEVYKNVFGKTYEDDPEGIAYWVRQLEEGNVTPGKLIADILYAAVTQYPDDPATKTLLNRAEVAVYVAQKVQDPDINKDGKVDDNDFQVFKNFIADVTDDRTTVDAAKQHVDEVVGGPVSNVIQMTTGPDNIVGTPGDDIIVGAVYSRSETSTYQTGDIVDGGDGNDTLQVSIASDFNGGAAGARIPLVTVKNVEKVVFYDNLGVNIPLDLYQGVQEIYVKNSSTGASSLQNIPLNVKVYLEGTGGFNLNYDGTAGNNDSVEVNLKNVGVSAESPSAITGMEGEIEHVKFVVSGNNYIAYGETGTNDNATQDITIVGQGNIDIALMDIGDANPNAAGQQFTLDATQVEGNVTVRDVDLVDIATAEITYKLGGGDDTVVAGVINPGVNNTYGIQDDVIIGGEGNDKLIFWADYNVAKTTFTYDDVNDDSLQGIEEIEVYNGTHAHNVNINLDKQTEGFKITLGVGNDVLVGSRGDDVIDAGKGNDIIEGGRGSDTITTGDGNDVVILDSPFAAVDKITDFAAGKDILVVSLTTENNVGAVANFKFSSPNGLDAKYTFKVTIGSTIFYAANIILSKTSNHFLFISPAPIRIPFPAGTIISQVLVLLSVTGWNVIFTGTKVIFDEANNKIVIRGTEGNGTLTLSKFRVGIVNTGILFFYDREDHKLMLYGLRVNTDGDSALELRVFTSRTIATITMSSGVLDDGSIFIL